ncbi:MAG: ABC transporter substrate-binding protein [Ilumatobacteraceae bacterium]
MRHKPVRVVAAVAAFAMLATACGKDRDEAVTTTTAPPSSSAAATTAPQATETTAATPTTAGTDSTAGADTTVAAETTLPPEPDVPMFGDAPWPCSAGDGANTDDGTEVGVTKDSINIASGDDAGYAGAPGLNHQITDAVKALVAECNTLGGINGRQITLNYFDAKLLEVGPAVQAACDGGNFFLVGEGWAFDGNQEEIRLGCGLPAVPAYSVSAAFAMGKDVFQGLPNPADETPAGIFAQTKAVLGDAVLKVGTLVGNYSATQETRDKVVAVAPEFGWGFANTTLEYSIGGEADWTPLVKQLQDSGATAVSWSGSCLPNLQLFAQSAIANGFNVPIITDANHYEQTCAAANTDGALDNLYLRMAFIPFEEADVNPATKSYVDLVEGAGGDISLLGAQATSSFLLWAQAASDCGAALTRACTLDNLKNTHNWTGHGLHAETDPGGNHPPSCNLLLHLTGTEYVRVAPTERGTFECDPTWVAKVEGVPALAAAKLDENRISQQFSGN